MDSTNRLFGKNQPEMEDLKSQVLKILKDNAAASNLRRYSKAITQLSKLRFV